MFAQKHSININGKIFPLDRCLVMGILNITPDSFYEASRKETGAEIRERVKEMINEGVDIIDIGGMSSRPGSNEISPEDEWERVERGLDIIRSIDPEIPVSLDTYRAKIARKAVDKFEVGIINDISAGEMDPDMYGTIAELNIPYIIMHMQGNPKSMQKHPITENATGKLMEYFHKKLAKLNEMGIHDVIIDPGFGFGKSIEANYEILNYLERFAVLEKPVLCGFSRKSMIYKHLGIQAENSLNGTSILNTIAVEKGCRILRVHDVRAAREVVELINFTRKQENPDW